MALQDVAVAALVYERATHRRVDVSMDINATNKTLATSLTESRHRF